MERRASISTHLSFQKNTVYQTIHTKIFIVKLLNTITSFKSVEQLEVFRSTSVCHGCMVCYLNGVLNGSNQVRPLFFHC